MYRARNFIKIVTKDEFERVCVYEQRPGPPAEVALDVASNRSQAKSSPRMSAEKCVGRFTMEKVVKSGPSTAFDSYLAQITTTGDATMPTNASRFAPGKLLYNQNDVYTSTNGS
ncbi:hypothetical protein KM043_008938 [Ampulex compressa]|nr:hypothetical protein KM043_008938 [Ampulex compressa]